MTKEGRGSKFFDVIYGRPLRRKTKSRIFVTGSEEKSRKTGVRTSPFNEHLKIRFKLFEEF